MSQSLRALKAEIHSAHDLLKAPCPDVDRTYLMLQADRFYAERQQQAILEWLPKLEQRLDEIVKAYDAEISEKDRRIAELEAQAAQPVEITQAPVLHVVGE